ncbi:hypothetical protein GJ744_010751 [Endocarpon pusillum]|uniref:linoleate 8R-lipoxygenase n=1 Tax=Endocarpon pusillum TaxID=364733 RepID=A0A8H7AG80_9EURO|nr:hypothetical protein GJ744_010751 [Endocarpon pusillum]
MSSKDFNAKLEIGDSYTSRPKNVRPSLLSNPAAVVREILADCAAVRQKYHFYQLLPLLEDLVKKGEPLDDKKGTTEQLIEILTLLPAESQLRTDLTNTFINTLWNNLQHPPLSYLGGNVSYQTDQEVEQAKVGKSNTKTSSLEPESVEFVSPVNANIKLVETVPTPPNAVLQYRTPDGSYNNILSPDLGRAGTPYAKSVRTEKKLAGVKPDAGLLFDLLMARGDNPGDFKENQAGVSSMLFYHASIIIHDIFRTNRADTNISDTSSYLDLAPLYGSSLKEQLSIRTMKEGKLKPDTFVERRLLGQPPGVNAILVLYSRFHNYVAEVLLKINEADRFQLAVGPDRGPVQYAKAIAKQDHDLFNTARLIVNGLYINICLHDYLRAITNTHASASNWTLDPRVEIDKHFDSQGTPRGIGNQVSAEFNLIYRFHSCISKRDETWTNKFFTEQIFAGKSLEEIHKMSEAELMTGVLQFSQQVPSEPEKREFGGYKRGADGKFRDEDLVSCLKASMDDPAGVFGARQVPKILRVVEILGIVQARKWQVASLNEFRDFFGLKRHQKFTDINSNQDIANILERLYAHPDMVELYPGLMIEDAKPVRSTGCGICPTYSVGRAILSDAITLVRSDRFNTIDYNVSNLTAWGYNEVKQDYETLGGSMFYKLIQRGLPGWFPYNSLNVMQPMYTKEANMRIAKSLKTIQLYTIKDPEPPRPVVVLTKHDDCKAVLEDHQTFVVPWLPAINDLFPGERDYSWYMLSGDGAQNFANRQMSEKILYGAMPSLLPTVKRSVNQWGRDWISKEGFKMAEGLYEIDILRDVVIPLNARLLADLFYLDLRTDDENPQGSLSYADVYKHLLNIRVWGSNNNDPAQAWNRRRWAQQSAKVIIDTTRPLVQEVANEKNTGGIFTFLSSFLLPNGSHGSHIKEGSLRSLGRKLVQAYLANGTSVEKTIDNLWLNGFGAVGILVTTFAECMEFFLRPKNVQIWSEVQSMAERDDDRGIRDYVQEAQRLTTRGRNMRITTKSKRIGEKSIAPGTAVVLMLGEAGRDASHVSNPLEFRSNRRSQSATSRPMQPFSDGIHHCFGREIAITFVCETIKLVAGLKDLRPAPGLSGQIKAIQLGTEKCFLNNTWSYLTFDPTTWKLHYSGTGKGTYKAAEKTAPKMNLTQIEMLIASKIGLEKL